MPGILTASSAMCGLHYNLSLPAWEFSLAKTQLETVLTWSSYVLLSREAGQLVGLHSVETPRPFTWLHAQTSLLCVDCEHRELRPGERSCKSQQDDVEISRLPYFTRLQLNLRFWPSCTGSNRTSSFNLGQDTDHRGFPQFLQENFGMELQVKPYHFVLFTN
jgi:hypothetical protein